MPTTPQRLGTYLLERRLGAGGMGEVYLAYDPRLQRRVVAKQIRTELKHPQARERLRREARAVARLNHPSIVQVYELLETRTGDWIVMEHVDGPTVAQQVRLGPLELPRALEVGRQVAEGLVEAHAKGIIHRDLKAENVVVAPSGQAKILDFGLARDLDAGSDLLSLTRSGAFVGTLRSAAPEQARGVPAGPRADLFSLGVLFYEMITGRSPFTGSTPAETLYRLLDEAPEPLPEAVPETVRALIDELLQKAQELRPASAAEVARRLSDLSRKGSGQIALGVETAGEETQVSGLSEIPVAPVPVAWWWSLGPAVAALFLVGLLLTALLLTAPHREGPPRPRREAGGAVQGLSPSQEARLHQEGSEALARYDLPGNLDRAIAAYQRLIEAGPGSPAVHEALALAYWHKFRQQGQDSMWLRQARAVARRAVRLDARRPSSRVTLALVLITAGDLEEARAELEAAPDSAGARRAWAELHQASGRHQAAEEELRQALRLDPGDRQLHDFLGGLLWRHGRLEEAESAFRRSIELAPDGFLGRRNLAGVLFSRGDLEGALEVIEAALEIQPTSSLYTNQGTILYYQGLYPQAARAFERALDIGGGANSYLQWANLGDAYRRLPGRKPEAAEAYHQALRLLEQRTADSPAHTDLGSRLALYRAKAGDLEGALRQAAAATAEDGRSLFRLAMTYELAGERTEALAHLAEALEAGFPVAEVEHEPEILELRADRRYHRLMARLGY